VNKYIIPHLGNNVVSKITEQHVTQFISVMLSNGRRGALKGLSPKTVSDIFAVLKGILKHGTKVYGLPTFDLSDVTVVKPDNNIRIFTQDEFTNLNRFLQRDTDSVKLGILICMYTGIRIGELCALKWEHISIDEQFLRIRSTLQRVQIAEQTTGKRTPGKQVGGKHLTRKQSVGKTKIIITSPKSSSSLRDIPIPGILLSILLARPEVEASCFVLTGRKDRYMEPRTVQYRFKSYLEILGIENANFHAIRHTFATRCVELEFELKCLSEILGHANVNITLNKYVHPSFDLKRKNMERLSVLFEKVCRKK
jgi:integrase